MTGWQSISTAPKDRDILVKGGTVHSHLGNIGRLIGVAHVRWDDDRDERSIMGDFSYSAFIEAPTHWHPVPEI